MRTFIELREILYTIPRDVHVPLHRATANVAQMSAPVLEIMDVPYRPTL
jgi:hypothetical protein